MGKRTSCEKYLIGGVVVLALASIGLLVGLIVIAVNDDDLDICLTEGCIETANMLKKRMNLDANPCEDFYEFACGRFVSESIIPDDKTSVSAFAEINNQMLDYLRLIVSEEIKADEILPFQNVKKLYRACLNLDKIDEAGISFLLDKIKSMGGWPILETSWNDQHWTWQRATQLMRENGFSVNSIFSFGVVTDPKNSTRRAVRIDQTSLGLSYSFIMKRDDDPFYRAYKQYQVDLVQLFAPSVDRQTIENAMSQALEFEFRLANISLTREERRNANDLYNPMTISELEGNYTYLQWRSYFDSITPPTIQFNDNDIIINSVPKFFKNLADFIDSTPKATIANYLMWRVALSSASYLPKEFRTRAFEYNKALTGREEEEPRGIQCTQVALNNYPHAVGSLYIRKHFKEEAKKSVNEMVENILEAFKGILREIDWMDEDTKANAIDKAEKMSLQMAYADELLDENELKQYYNNFPVVVHEDKYYESILNLGIASTTYNLNRLNKPVNKTEWPSFTTPATVNAFYSSTENTMKFPAGILQGAFFNVDRPNYMNYGGIGFVVGHEITHGFDDQGSRYDAYGNLEMWWGDETRRKFDEKAKCIIDQYGGYKEPQTGLYLNGNMTQGENIADNGGIKESYFAYEKWVRDNKEEKKLPGIDLTPKQLFWVSSGQIWCNKQRDASLRDRVLNGVHSPSQFRVNGPMSNSYEFSRDFGCPLNSAMNPSQKCTVW